MSNHRGGGDFRAVDIEQFRRGFHLFLYTLSERRKLGGPLPDADFSRAIVVAGELFDDEMLRVNFYQRIDVFRSIAGLAKYDAYIGFVMPSLHLKMVAALANFRFSSEMTEKACIAAFDAELQRQCGDAGERERQERPVSSAMNKATLQQYLNRADGHIDDARRRIERQTSLLNELKAAGRDTRLAQRLLDQFVATLQTMRANQDSIRALLQFARN